MIYRVKNILLQYSKQFVLIFLILISFQIIGIAQCTDQMVEKAIKNSGINTLFVREFKFKSEKKKSRLFPASANYEVRLNGGYLYRFIVEKADEYENIPILQLYENNILMGSTYNSEKQMNEKHFDFLCPESNDFEVILSFRDNRVGCAAGIMSIVITDSVDLKKLKDDLEQDNILYTGTDNYLNIATTNSPKGKLILSISKGTIAPENGLYKVRVDDEGEVTIRVNSLDSIGNSIETNSFEFKVVDALPFVTFLGRRGGIVSRLDMEATNLHLSIENIPENMNYYISSFSVSSKLTELGIATQESELVNFRQINFLKTLKSGDSFFIKDIMIKNEKGRRYKLQPLGFIIE